MAKRLKLKFSRVIPSFQFCRSKQTSILPQTPLPSNSIYCLSPINPKVFDIGYPESPSQRSPISRHVAPKGVTVGCGCRPRSRLRHLSPNDVQSPLNNEVEFRVVTRASDRNSRREMYWPSEFSDEDDKSPMLPIKTENNNTIKQKKSKKKTKPSVRTSASSAEGSWFSSDGGDDRESETLASSSTTFSNDSLYDFDNHNPNPNENISNKKKKSAKKVKKLNRFVSKKWKISVTGRKKTTASVTPESRSPERTMMMMMPPCAAAEAEGEEKLGDSFAVVKKSDDPYEDFKRSMLEMILEKQIFEEKDLEQLLHCFLSLNSKHHHVVIVEAFSEIWEALFSKSPLPKRL